MRWGLAGARRGSDKGWMRRRLGGLVCGILFGCGGGGEAEEASEAGEASAASETELAPTTDASAGTMEPPGGCADGLLACAGTCVDTQHDPMHCGGCGQACAGGLVCVGGRCGVACGATATACGEDCVDLQIDPGHCGACDHACAPGVDCVAGQCAPDCAEGEQVCGEICVDAGKDEAHCGGCDVACAIGESCVYGECMGAAVNHVLITGQSLSTGATSPVVSAVQPFMNVSFNTGVRAGAVGLTGFIPLIETWDGSQGETIASGLANLVAAQAQAQGGAHVMLVSAHGIGGQPYSVLKKGSPAFAAGMAQVTAGMTIAGMLGQSYAVRAVTVVHGEADQIGGNLGYAKDLLAWQSDYEADVAAIVGVARPLPLFLCQMSSFTAFAGPTSIIPALQLEASRARPDRVFVVTPKYFMPYTDGVHLTGDGERWLGEYYAKAYRKVLIDGERWTPLQPASVTREGAVITIAFAVPAPPLVLDETLVSNPGNYGFEFADASGAPPAIVAVALVDDVTVQVTLASAPVGGNRRIRYAYTGMGGQPAGPMTGARGNLRDSDPAKGNNGYLLYNWSVHFDEPVP